MKIFFLLMIISMPEMPTVRYNAFLYLHEDQCLVARDGYIAAYNAKDELYRSKIKTEAFCIPFDSFPLKGMIAPLGA
tara:strand:+ start:1291 stop:1521 length:231 start_codon:yes stop_codon:yes gene_type:complete